MTKEEAYQKATLEQVGNNPHGTRMDIIYRAMEIYAGSKTIEKDDKLNEKDLIIYGIEEGAENWKAEYDNCRKILENLCELKRWKDENINMDAYPALKPVAWQAAKEFLSKYQHI